MKFYSISVIENNNKRKETENVILLIRNKRKKVNTRDERAVKLQKPVDDDDILNLLVRTLREKLYYC